ncbi:Modification methylase DpnIIB [Novipirellula aureliae]|uniref:site-specific DNA-methyltransferase (adenine-specific) n=1 Tax=Novipirellula aureliae TaxID=2527966 RepID=A0A5C6DIG0_9BACT|nr:site-specific DNA-methyltransferase [Novipirellula aureliae]TWU35647.1 Modification methylase DpnIIB [Novipirellula aureliae]
MAKKASRKKATKKTVETLRHADSRRTNIPTAEQQSVMETEDKYSIRVAYERRNRDLDPQLVWRGKDEQDAGPLVANAPPLYIQEKVHPKVLIDDLMRRTDALKEKGKAEQLDLFGDFNGLPEEARSAEFYQHDANWTNRMILGDSLQVMASLAEREGLRGKVQCIYFDPPYGIKFNSNFQWSTENNSVTDGKREHITREPEQVKAFRDTWSDGIHSYLAYLRDRLIASHQLLSETGCIFLQIGDKNVHNVRVLLDEVFGSQNCVATITYKSAVGMGAKHLDEVATYLLFYAKDKASLKYRTLFKPLTIGEPGATRYLISDEQMVETRKSIVEAQQGYEAGTCNPFFKQGLTSRSGGDSTQYPVSFRGKKFRPTTGGWRTNVSGMNRVKKASRIAIEGTRLAYKRRFGDFPFTGFDNIWDDISGGIKSRSDPKVYVVQTSTTLIERCILQVTDPGDLVLDPTCGAGTTGFVAEQWGRRWITIDTSRVALALARSRIIGARYPYYLLKDSEEGKKKEAELGSSASEITKPTNDLRVGFSMERYARISLRSIAHNAEIDVIYDAFQTKLEPIREELNAVLGESWEDWQIPREAGQRWENEAVALHASLIDHRKRLASTLEVLDTVELSQHADKVREIIAAEVSADLKKLNALVGMKGKDAFTLDTLPEEPRDPWPDEAKKLHAKWWKLRIERQKEIDASIAAKADFEYLYDKPYEDKTKVRVAGPFTVESLSPHRTLSVGENDELIDPLDAPATRTGGETTEIADFATMILDNLKKSGVQQAHKEDKIDFTSLVPWPGQYIAAEGRFNDESGKEQRAGIFIGPEFGTISQPDLKAAARECGDADFDVLIACGFNYEAHATEFNKLGRIQVLKARMNADMHMSADLKNTGKGNLFVIFGEPDITVRRSKAKAAKMDDIEVQINGVDVFQPSTGEVRSDGAEGIACWFVDTDYNEESFFVRQAYFLGANDPYKSLKTTLKAEVDKEAWDSLNSDVSRPFPQPKSGRIAVKVINHLGDEVMKVFRVKEVLE